MGKLIFNSEKIKDMDAFLKLCPFGALVVENGKVSANAACKMCKLCVKNGPDGAAVFVEDEVKAIDKSFWNGVAVYVDNGIG